MESSLKQFAEEFDEQEVYPCIFYKDDIVKNRLTQNKRTWKKPKGFKFKKGEASYPTFFALDSIKWCNIENKNHLVFCGLIMDDVEHDYELCLSNSKQDYSDLDHSNKGDKVYIFFDTSTSCQAIVSRKIDDVKYYINSQSQAVKIKKDDLLEKAEKLNVKFRSKPMDFNHDWKRDIHSQLWKDDSIDNFLHNNQFIIQNIFMIAYKFILVLI